MLVAFKELVLNPELRWVKAQGYNDHHDDELDFWIIFEAWKTEWTSLYQNFVLKKFEKEND